MDLEFQSGDVILQFISPTEKWNRNPSRQFQELIERLRTKHWSYWEALQETVGRRIQRYEEMLNSRTIVFLISKPTSSLKKEANKEDQDKNKGKEEVNEKVIENKKDEEGKDKEKHMIEKQKKKKEEEEHLEELRSRFETFANATPGVLYFFVDISNKEEIERMMVDVIRHQIAGKGISVKPYDHVEPEGKENGESPFFSHSLSHFSSFLLPSSLPQLLLLFKYSHYSSIPPTKDLEMKKKKEFPTLDFRETEKPAASSFRPFYSLVMTALFGKE